MPICTRGKTMIVKFFKRGGTKDNKISTGGEGVKNYLLGKDNDREKASLLAGDPNETTEIINGLGFNKIYTSGCLSFDGEESQRITDQQKYEIMQNFERTLFGDFDKSRISGYWVEHTDKVDSNNGLERLELNFVFANVDLATGKNLPVYYHKNDLSRINDYKDLTNLTYGLSDPNATQRKQASVISNNQSQDQKQLKQAINDHLMTLATKGRLQNHDSVKQAITDLGLTITATKNKSISIKNPDPSKTRPIRLTGAFYEQQYKIANIINQPADSPSPADRNAELTSYQQDLKVESQKELATFSTVCDQERDQIQKRLEQNLTEYQTAENKIHQQIQAIINLPTIIIYILIWSVLSMILSILILAWFLQKLLIILLVMVIIAVSLSVFYLINSRQQKEME